MKTLAAYTLPTCMIYNEDLYEGGYNAANVIS